MSQSTDISLLSWLYVTWVIANSAIRKFTAAVSRKTGNKSAHQIAIREFLASTEPKLSGFDKNLRASWQLMAKKQAKKL